MNPRSLTVSDDPDPLEVAFLEYQVMAATVAATGHADGQELAVFIRDDDGELAAGLYGWTWGGCCELQTLWVDPTATGQGLARTLIAAAEEEARRRGCTQVVLFTHDAQTSGLYPKLGYVAAGVVEGYPAGDVARWYRKPLANGDTGP